MKRRIIKIDESKCNGCGACAKACHEGAIKMVSGVARLVREDYCDGLGDCLPACPTGAISFEVREAPQYDGAAVLAAKEKDGNMHQDCPGTRAALIGALQNKSGGVCENSKANGEIAFCPGSRIKAQGECSGVNSSGERTPSRLMQWPCQIKLVPTNAPYLNGANLLIAADCTAYAYSAIHEEFMKGRITLIGCPKLDGCDYSDKLTDIIRNNDIMSVTVVRMEVPCCSGIEHAARRAVEASGKLIPWRVVTISTDGKILS